MDNPNYILKFDERVLMPKKQSKSFDFIKKGVFIIIAIIVVSSLIFQENLFSEMSWTARILLIIVALAVLFIGGKNENVPSPMELQFFDDYMILYRPKRYYSKKVTRMEIDKMMYSDITRCVYRAKSQRMSIHGNLYATWYNYDKNGVVSQTPNYDRFVEKTLSYFSTRCATDVDFVKEIEEHSPLKVIVENS